MTSTQVQLPTPTRPSYPDNIEALLNSNCLPSPEEEFEVRKLRQDVINEVDNLKAEIARTEARLISMRKQLSDSERRIADYTDVLNPVRRLPPDVLTEIFNLSAECDPESISNMATGSLHPKEMHWILPQVSSYWRSVALSSAQLWSTIRIADYELLPPLPLLMLSLQLHRAGSHPLSVLIRSKTSSIQLKHPILQTLLPFSPRWRVLSLYMPLGSLTKVVLAVRLFLSSLTSMHLWSDETQPAETSTALSIVPSIYPSLRRVSGNPSTLSACSILGDQITTYSCDRFCMMQDHLKLLSLLPNLRECRIRSYAKTAADTHVVLHHLERISIYEPRDSNWPILNHLTPPSLKFLEIPVYQLQPLARFLNRSKCSLIMLSLTSRLNRMNEDASLSILTALSYLPSLELLAFHCRSEVGVSGLVNRIIKTPTLVPLLQSLFVPNNVAMFPAADVSRWQEARPGLVLRQLSKYTDLLAWFKFGVPTHLQTRLNTVAV